MMVMILTEDDLILRYTRHFNISISWLLYLYVKLHVEGFALPDLRISGNLQPTCARQKYQRDAQVIGLGATNLRCQGRHRPL